MAPFFRVSFVCGISAYAVVMPSRWRCGTCICFVRASVWQKSGLRGYPPPDNNYRYRLQLSEISFRLGFTITQTGLRLKSRAISVITVREAYRGTAHIGVLVSITNLLFFFTRECDCACFVLCR